MGRALTQPLDKACAVRASPLGFVLRGSLHRALFKKTAIQVRHPANTRLPRYKLVPGSNRATRETRVTGENPKNVQLPDSRWGDRLPSTFVVYDLIRRSENEQRTPPSKTFWRLC